MNGMWGLLSDIWVLHKERLHVVQRTKTPVWGCESIMSYFVGHPFSLFLHLSTDVQHCRVKMKLGDIVVSWKRRSTSRQYLLFPSSQELNRRVYVIDNINAVVKSLFSSLNHFLFHFCFSDFKNYWKNRRSSSSIKGALKQHNTHASHLLYLTHVETETRTLQFNEQPVVG